MFVFLSKFLPLWVYPTGIITICLIAGIVLVRRYPRLTQAILAAALAVLFIAGNRWVSTALARSLEWRYLPPAEVPEAGVIVVLGGGTQAADYPRSTVEINGAGDRMLYAIQLYNEGKAPFLLMSGGYIEWLNDNPVSPAEDMAQLAMTFGVPAEAIWLQPESQNTYEGAVYSAQILRERGIDRALLVTSALHMPRSVALFEAQGIDVVPLPTDYTVTQREWEDLTRGSLQEMVISLVPNVSNLSVTTTVMKEYIGMLVYSLRGWM